MRPPELSRPSREPTSRSDPPTCLDWREGGACLGRAGWSLLPARPVAWIEPSPMKLRNSQRPRVLGSRDSGAWRAPFEDADMTNGKARAASCVGSSCSAGPDSFRAGCGLHRRQCGARGHPHAAEPQKSSHHDCDNPSHSSHSGTASHDVATMTSTFSCNRSDETLWQTAHLRNRQ
jgi:hypothetical protein